MNILYIHPAGTFGGASKSLVELFLVLKQHKVTGYVITPKGSSAKAFKNAGMYALETNGLSQFDNTKFGYYRGLRWLILLREIFLLPASILSLIRTKALNVRFDFLHINDITLLPIGILAKWLFRIPLIVHVRSVQRGNCSDLRTKLVFNMLHKYSDAIICIDETVLQSIPYNIKNTVIHNGLGLGENEYIRPEKQSEIINVGMVGVLLKMKGVYEFIEAAKILCLDRKLNVGFYLYGVNARLVSGIKAWIYKRLRFSENVELGIQEFIKKNKLENNIFLKGFVSDVRDIYPNLDVLCFPSYLNAVGRPVFEAAFYGIPSVVAVKNAPADSIQHGITGLAIEKPDALLLANALEQLILDSNYRNQLGSQAKNWAHRHFDIQINAKKLFGVYQELISSRLQG